MDYRAIVERHFGKHTGLRHPAKACPHPDMTATEAGREAGDDEVQNAVKSRPIEQTRPEKGQVGAVRAGSGGERSRAKAKGKPRAGSDDDEFEIRHSAGG
jgi:hypothetical protein